MAKTVAYTVMCDMMAGASLVHRDGWGPVLEYIDRPAVRLIPVRVVAFLVRQGSIVYDPVAKQWNMAARQLPR
ncbi:MAG: hypothetical protein ABI119_05920 [Gemmatimonadaceae bacterium]